MDVTLRKRNISSRGFEVFTQSRVVTANDAILPSIHRVSPASRQLACSAGSGRLRPSGFNGRSMQVAPRSSKGHLAEPSHSLWQRLDVNLPTDTTKPTRAPPWTEQTNLRSSSWTAGAITSLNRQSLGGDSTGGSFTPLSNWKTGRRSSPSVVGLVDSPAPGPWVYRGGICWEPTDPKGGLMTPGWGVFLSADAQPSGPS